MVITIGVVSLSALAYWATHRNVAQRPVSAAVAPKIIPALPGIADDKPTRLVAKTLPASKPRPVQPAVIPEKKQPLQADMRREPTEQTSELPVAAVEQNEPVRPAPAPRPTLAQTEIPAPPTPRPAAQRVAAERAKKRPSKPAEPTSDESDLERALNKNQ